MTTVEYEFNGEMLERAEVFKMMDTDNLVSKSCEKLEEIVDSLPKGAKIISLNSKLISKRRYKRRLAKKLAKDLKRK